LRSIDGTPAPALLTPPRAPNCESLRHGTALGGGLSFLFSDMLGDQLAARVELNSGLNTSFSPK
jgi:hypothetical protein